MGKRESIMAEQLIKAFVDSGQDVSRPATVEDVCRIVGGVVETILREGEAQRVADQIIHDLKRPRGEA